ncbi:NYN domain-containing protein [Planctomyces sp. SH-PL62]|uniref:NYN domain-containing protein n=1 Tax=Planctomyces sp. SH-PL62 TaxID=1636152 RepID=UPI00078B6E03|nr:NYN domain-containing protein [Planctomyces sp. SH-PL62]AMV36941.1 YacP-like NYN domain protein [Planctomyces sp. SH-PL62]
MRWLIDGYNLMHAAGVVDSKMGRHRFRDARRRFLDRLARSMGDHAFETTVVFDANQPPADFPIESNYRGITVVFAVADASADDRIERILARHSTPKTLTVVSNDREVRKSATSRKAQAIKADDFLDRMSTIAYENRPAAPSGPDPEAVRRAPVLDDAERAYWQEVFGAIDLDPPARERPWSAAKPGKTAPKPAPPAPDHRRVARPVDLDVRDVPSLRAAMLTDADIAAIQREIDREG